MSSFDSSLVSVDWLYQNINLQDLVILDGSIPKVTANGVTTNDVQLPNARFFDIKKKFSDINAPFPNTVPSEQQFTEAAQELGINSNSLIVVYDDKGIYSSARVWYLFKTFGHNKIAVLDGGLPEWIEKGYPVEKKITKDLVKGNFVGVYRPNNFKFFDDIEKIKGDTNYQILDARSSDRFNGTIAEPRAGLRSGNIPSSKNLPFKDLMNGNCMKNKSELQEILTSINSDNKELVFTCGSGITACIIALAATVANTNNPMSVYDGSWTEYGTLTDA